MRRILSLVLGFIFLAVGITGNGNFIEEVKDAYDQYEVVTSFSNEEYSLCVVRGFNNAKASFGVFFYSECEGEYYCVINDGTYTYTLDKANNRGDVFCLAIKFARNIDIQVLDCDDNLASTVTVKAVNATTFNGIEGNGNSAKFSTTTKEGSYASDLLYFYLIALGVIATCAIIIIVIKVKKRGLFNDEVRMQNKYEFYNFANEYKNKDLHIHEHEYGYENEVEVVDEEEEPQEIYTRTRDYDDDLDETRPSVKSLLEAKGYNTDYSNLVVEEKNSIMIQLMMMRDQKEINNEEYQHEVIELWKK